MANHFDVIVIGTGGVGSAAIYHLARRSKKVLGLDAYQPGHCHGSSHGETRVIRQAYFEHPDYVPLLLRAYELWRELEKETGENLLVKTGLLQVGSPDGEVLTGVLKAAELHRLDVHPLTAKETKARFPQFNIKANQAGVFEPAGGYLLVEKCVRAHFAAAQTAGAVWKQERVKRLHSRGAVQLVETDNSVYTADRIIVTAGPWVGQLLPFVDKVTTVLQKQQLWFSVPESSSSDQYSPPGFPIFLFEASGGIFYGFPTIDGTSLKVAEHSGGLPSMRRPPQTTRPAKPANASRRF